MAAIWTKVALAGLGLILIAVPLALITYSLFAPNVPGFLLAIIGGDPRYNAQFVRVGGFYQDQCQVTFTDSNGYTSTITVKPCAFSFNTEYNNYQASSTLAYPVSNWRLDIEAVSRSQTPSALFTTAYNTVKMRSNSDTMGGGVKVSQRAGNTAWYFEAFKWAPQGYNTVTCGGRYWNGHEVWKYPGGSVTWEAGSPTGGGSYGPSVQCATKAQTAKTSYPERLVYPSWWDKTDYTKFEATEGVCVKHLDGNFGVLKPVHIERATQAVGSTISCLALSNNEGCRQGSNACNTCDNVQASCYIDGPTAPGPIDPLDTASRGAKGAYWRWGNPCSDACDTYGWERNEGTRIKDSSNTFQLEWKGGKIYFSIVNPNFYSSEAVARDNITTQFQYREIDCPIKSGYMLASQDFASGSTVALNNFRYPVQFFCKATPVVVLDALGKQIYTTTRPYEVWGRDYNLTATFQVPTDQVWEFFYVMRTPDIPIICAPKEVGRLSNGQCPPGATDTGEKCYMQSVFDANNGTCVVKPGIVHLCTDGIFDERTLSCAVYPDAHIVCPSGTTYVIPPNFNYTLYKLVEGEFEVDPTVTTPYCKYIAPKQAKCDYPGSTYDSILDKCVYTPARQPICASDSIYDPVGDICKYYPRVHYVCPTYNDDEGNPHSSSYKGMVDFWVDGSATAQTYKCSYPCPSGGFSHDQYEASQHCGIGYTYNDVTGKCDFNLFSFLSIFSSVTKGPTPLAVDPTCTSASCCTGSGRVWTGECIIITPSTVTTTTMPACWSSNNAGTPECRRQVCELNGDSWNSATNTCTHIPSDDGGGGEIGEPDCNTGCCMTASVSYEACQAGYTSSTPGSCVKNPQYTTEVTCPAGFTKVDANTCTAPTGGNYTCDSGWYYDFPTGKCAKIVPSAYWCTQYGGTYDVSSGKCYKPVPGYTCQNGFIYDSVREACIMYRPLNETYICIRGTYDPLTQKCLVPETATVYDPLKGSPYCDKGTYDAATNKCMVPAETSFVSAADLENIDKEQWALIAALIMFLISAVIIGSAIGKRIR